MLTENEKQWLDEKRHKTYCRYCNVINLCSNPFAFGYTCPLMAGNMTDALEFSERVAMKLAKHIHNKPLVCETNWDCPYWPKGKCAWCYLKAARLEVEEEMDAG